MTQFLATLHSPASNRSAISIFDTTRGQVYLQFDELPKWLVLNQFRGVAFFNNELYVTTPAGVLVFSLERNAKLPVFRLKREIRLPEWAIGTTQADLMGILISKGRHQILVANNLFNAIDEFNLQGEFVKRHFLYKIAPDVFPMPEVVDQAFNFGHIRGMIESPSGEILISVHAINGTEKGCVVNFDHGNVYLDDVRAPHAGMFVDGRFIIQESSFGRISSLNISVDGAVKAEPVWSSSPKIGVPRFVASTQVVRGMICLDDTIYSGVYYPGRTVDLAIPPFIARFDAKTGRETEAAIPLISKDDFVRPRAFFMAPLPDDIFKPKNGVSAFYAYEDREIVLLHAKPEYEIAKTSLPGKQSEKTSSNSNPMEKEPVIVLDRVSLSYRRTAVSHFSFKKHLREAREFHVLKDLSFSIYEGETVGIIGRNGSGKSTISMLISGALKADSGLLTTKGHVQLLSIGLGFQPNLTGRENVFINGALLGLSKQQILSKLPEIEDFSEIGEFFDEPVRTYSAGMRSRLGFAVATAVRPDVLILDEVLSTGDVAFRRKATDRMSAMREQTKTIIMVSHNSNQIKKVCSRVIWLHKGTIVMDGDAKKVFPHYQRFCRAPDDWMSKHRPDLVN